MLGRKIIDIVERLPLIFQHFCGVFTIDQIELVRNCLKPKTFAIINTSTHPGQHWFLIFRNSRYFYEIFDPLGYPSLQRLDVQNYFRGNFVYNTTAVQPRNSKLCGEFCIIFAIHRILRPHLSFVSLFNKIFSKTDLKANHLFISEYISWLI